MALLLSCTAAHYQSTVDHRLTPAEFARQLRRNPTDAERALWRVLARLRPRFTKQYRVGPYVADFACRRARLILEVDGSQHGDSGYDARRTDELAASGWRVLRDWNNDVLTNTEGVVLDIMEQSHPRLPPGEQFVFVSPRPSRRRQK